MDLYTLFSGSSGNCTYIKDGSTEILIDAGVSCKRISESLKDLGSGLENIKAIFITHEHIDHVRALATIAKHFDIPFFITLPCADKLCSSLQFPHSLLVKNIRIIEPEASYDVDDLLITPFETPHDSASSVGYIVENEREVFGLATDIGHVTAGIENKLSICKKVVLESNHDIQMLKQGPYPEYLKARILSSKGHLSNADCAHFAARLAQSGVESIVLAHISKENNTQERAYSETAEFLKKQGINDIKLKIASEEGAVLV